MELETLPESLEDVTLEEITIEEIQSVPETSELDLLQQDSVTLPTYLLEDQAPVVMAAPMAVQNAATFSADDNVYALQISGSTYNVLFPEDAALKVSNDILINVGSINITGVVLDSYTINTQTYSSRYLTLLPITSSTSNTSRYRYQSAAYFTVYSPGAGNTLTSTTAYVTPYVLEKPNIGHGLDSSTIIIATLLLILVITNFIGGIFRR